MKKRPLKLQAFDLWDATDMEIPALMARIPAGEPMELGGEMEMVDLNYLLTKDTPNAFLLRVDGDSMIPEISHGDWILVSRSLSPEVGHIIVASVNGAHTLKRLKRNDVRGKAGLYLVPTNGNITTRELQPTDDFRILGVVTKIITDPRRRNSA